MQYVVKLDRDELLRVLTALQNDADSLDRLAFGMADEELNNSFKNQARSERILYRKILDTYESID